MELKNLPEKEYFTREEMARRWGTDIDLIDYYLRHGPLREAVYTPNASFFDIQCSRFYKCSGNSAIFQRAINQLYLGYELNKLLEDENIIFDEKSITYCPRFAYLNNDPYMFVEDYDYNNLQQGVNIDPPVPLTKLLVLFLSGPNDDRYIPVALKHNSNKSCKEWSFNRLYIKSDIASHLVIPREERDRFEQEHGILSPQKQNVGTKEREGLLKTIGAFAMALSMNRNGLDKGGDEISANAMTSYLLEHVVEKDGGLSERSLRARIKEGLSLIEVKKKG